MPIPKSKSAGVVMLGGSFAPAGSSAPTSPKGAGYTVARTGTGTYTLTLSKRYVDILSVTATAQCNSAAGFSVEAGAVSVSGKTVVLRTLVSGAAADVSANANNRVNFYLHLKDSSARP